MNTNIILSVLLQSLIVQLPVIAVALIACIVTVMNWQQSPSASRFSLIGFGLMLALCFVIPIVQSFAQLQFMPPGGSAAHTRFLLTELGFLWAILRAVSYGFLLAAVYTGRSDPRTMGEQSPPELPR
ncbi:MAG: hypothetical protein WCD79_14250 [Chthoniobacteraceae bacterium]